MLLYDQIDSTNDRPVRPETRIAVKRALADAVLTLSARVVMAYLLMDHPQAVKRAKCPPLYATAAALGLCTRTVQRAYDELEREGWLDDSRGGPDDLPDAPDAPERHRLLHQPPGSLPARRAPPPTLPPPTLSQQVEGYEVLRERALAANKLNIALRAHIELGRTMGYDRPKKERADRNAGATTRPPSAPLSPPPPSKMREGRGGGDACETVEGRDLPPPSLPHIQGGREQEDWPELAETGAALDLDGTELAKAGANWRELAGVGCPETSPEAADSGYFLRPVNDLAWKDRATRGPEVARADAEWENYCRARNAERRRMGLEPDMEIEGSSPAGHPLQLSVAVESDKFSTVDRHLPAAAAPGPI